MMGDKQAGQELHHHGSSHPTSTALPCAAAGSSAANPALHPCRRGPSPPVGRG